jgi:5-formyltetrahydrofolate cyclo-ligase
MDESNKNTLRVEARRHRARMDVRVEDPIEASNHFFSAIKPEKGQVISAYWPFGREFDSRPLIEKLLEEGFTCTLPVMKKDEKILGFARWQEDMLLKETDYEVMEPVVNDKTEWLEPDIVVVPLLAFDRRGYRLGQGGGHYDATLADLRARKKIVAVGLAYAQQACLFNLPVEDHDQKLDWVITPQGAQSFNP